jgi:hypothetical protein
VRCARCGRVKVDAVLIDIGALSPTQTRALRLLRYRVSHGMCPTCYDGRHSFWGAALGMA